MTCLWSHSSSSSQCHSGLPAPGPALLLPDLLIPGTQICSSFLRRSGASHLLLTPQLLWELLLLGQMAPPPPQQCLRIKITILFSFLAVPTEGAPSQEEQQME